VKQARDRRRYAAAPGVRQHEVADLHDLPLGIEVVQGATPDHLAVARIERSKRQQPTPFGQHRQLVDRGDEPVAIESRKVSGLAQLRVPERRQDGVDVVE